MPRRLPARPLLLLTLLPILSLAAHAGIFADKRSASPYDHDRVGKLAGSVLLQVCGLADPAESQALLIGLPDWQASAEQQPEGVVLRNHRNFAGEVGADTSRNWSTP